MKQCDLYIELMQKQLDERLSELEEKMLQKHLSCCPICAADYAAFQEMAQIFNEIDLEEPPVGVKELIMAEIMELQDEQTDQEIAVQRRWGISLLAIIAMVNSILFVLKILPNSWVVKISVDRMVIYQMFTQMFNRYTQIGHHMGKALQLAFELIIQAMPWRALLYIGGITILLVISLGGMLLYERKVN